MRLQRNAYILSRSDTTITRSNLPTEVAFKNCAPFIKCITKIDGTAIYDAKYLDLVMPMYNLLEYNSNYFYITASLWFYSKDEATNFKANIEDNNAFKLFEYKDKLLENTEADGVNGILHNASHRAIKLSK